MLSKKNFLSRYVRKKDKKTLCISYEMWEGRAGQHLWKGMCYGFNDYISRRASRPIGGNI